ncbi:MAG: HD-GYP domain-containing protein [Candidatus Omnitrophica bacterium]|nr:HD-GYP domain-containing protein [Candidatus Omnitrophota bacterium]MCM8827861.1 HD-GYP domain-containing protein [Candidatus Omnitrophota bacterium]
MNSEENNQKRSSGQAKDVELLQKELEKAYREIEALKKTPDVAFFESARQWRNIFDAIPEPICLLDANLLIIKCNASMAQLLNKPYHEILGKKLDDFAIDITFVDTVKNLFSKMKKELTRHIEIINTGNNWYEIVTYPLIEHPVKGLVILRNITHLKKIEEDLEKSHTRLKKTFHGTIDALATTLEKRDPFTAGHERRVAQIAQAIAIELGADTETIEGILISGLVHDIGKIVVPAEILSRPGGLNSHEYNLVKHHPEAGYEILKKIEFPWPVADAVLQHHERFDGSGYPNKLTEKKIIFEARILAVADSCEAMLSNRPYRKAKTINQMIAELQELKGIHFDEKVVDACVKLFKKKNFKIE